MCCGNDYDGLEAAMAAPSGEGVMARVFTTVPGLVLQIGNFGPATNTEAAVVDDATATQLEAEIKGEVEVEVPDPADPAKRKREIQKFAKGPRKDIRVERDAPAPKTAPKGKEA